VSSKDQSINSEPHLRSGDWQMDSSESKAAKRIERDTQQEKLDDRVHHSVWNEPGVSSELSGPPPEDALTYSNWLTHRTSQTGFLDSWVLVFCWALVAGPLARNLGDLVRVTLNSGGISPLASCHHWASR